MAQQSADRSTGMNGQHREKAKAKAKTQLRKKQMQKP
jgi:hypothetical protein